MHCGQPKTGTTTLQVSLHAATRELRKYGVCYPQGWVTTRHTHKAIAPLFMNRDRLSAHLVYDGVRRRADDELMVAARKSWDRIRREVERTKPELLVLSAETYCSMRTPAEAERLRELLSELSDDVTVMMYLRNPADRYLSAVRQHAKSRGHFLLPTRVNVRPFLESIETVFDRRPEVRVYDRAHLVDNDIVADFLASQLDGRVPRSAVPAIESNVSLTTEAAELMLRFREHAAPETKGFSVADAGLLKRVVRQVDLCHPRATPDALRPQVRDDVIRSADELDWIRDHFGVELPGVAYPVVDGGPLPDLNRYTSLDEVCVIDQERLELITAMTLNAFVGTVQRQRSRSLRGVARRGASLLPEPAYHRLKRSWRWKSDPE